MIKRHLKAAGILYQLSPELGAEAPKPFPLGDARPRAVDRAARVLESLWVEGRLEGEGTEFLLPWRVVYELDSNEARALELPEAPAAGLSLEVRAVGSATADDFAIRVKTVDLKNGVIPDSARHGPAFTVPGGLILAPLNALPLFEALDRDVGRDITSRLLHIGEVKKAARACGATLDSFLTHEEVVVPDAVGLEAEVVSPDEVLIRPILEGEDAEEFTGFSRSGGRTRAAYTSSEGGTNRRVVLTQAQRAAADEVRKRQSITGPDVPRFFTNPEAFVPEGLDLTHFSRRVKGLIPRKYTSQPYVRAQSKGRDWFTISAQVELAGEAADLGPATFGEDGAEGPESPGGDRQGPGAGAPIDEGDLPPSVSPDEYADLCRTVAETGERFVRHGDVWIEIDPETAQQYLRTWDSLDRDEQGGLILHTNKANYVLDVIDNLHELIYDESQTEPQSRTFLDQIPDYAVPRTLNAQLMPHQIVGYRWLRFLEEHRVGGLLADDMGLGKTIQVISFLAHLADRDLISPTLIVLPSALVDNWHREIRKFCPDIHLIYHHIGGDRLKDPQRIAQSEVVLTTYQTLLRDQLVMGQIDWQLVVSDEAQFVKNPTAQSTAVLKAMKAKLRLALTGTPVENGLSELWCIIDFVQPGRLGSQRDFREEFERPIRDAENAEAVREVATRLQGRLTPHYVRRMKEDILESLPHKEIRKYPVSMGERQLRYYGRVIKRLREGDDIPIAALQRLIGISSHPELFRTSGEPVDALVEECPKLQKTLEIVEEIRAKGEKVLIYTHLKDMQAILQELLEQRFDVHVPIINGGVAGNRRLDVVDRFNNREGFGAMLLAPQAAGVGLNITGANHVIHYTRLWNPAKEGQATDRAHRLGQTKPVTVYYPIVEGEGFTSVEERLAELLDEKRELARNVVWPRSSLDVGSEMQAWLREEGGA